MLLQKRERIGDAALRQVVEYIVSAVLVDDALGFRNALFHLRERRAGADRVRAGLDDQRRALDLRDFVHEPRVGPVADEALEPVEIVLADLAEHPFDEPRIGLSHRNALIDGLCENGPHAALRGFAEPPLALVALETRRRAEEKQAFHAVRVVDREELRGIAARRSPENMRPL